MIGRLAAAALVAAAASAFQLRAPDFAKDGSMPPAYGCGGTGATPALEWVDPPKGTKSFALLVQEADVPKGTGRVQWVVYGIPAEARSLPRRTLWLSKQPDGIRQGADSFGKLGFTPPCPELGRTRTYSFTLYALDAAMPRKIGLSAGQLAQAMRGHVLGQAALSATFRRL